MKRIISVIASCVLLAMCCAGCGSKDSKKDETTDNQGIEMPDLSGITGNTEDDLTEDVYTDQDSSSDNNVDYMQKADQVVNNVNAFFTALKNGDIDTVAKYSLEDSDVLEGLLDCQDKATASELMKLVFKDLEWKITDENKEEFADTLEFKESQGDYSEIGFDMYIVDHNHMYMDEFYFASLPEGTTFPEDYTAANENEAKDMLNKILDITPYIYDDFIFIEQINSDGSFKTDLDSILTYDMLPWDEIERTDSSNMFSIFLREILYITSDATLNTFSSDYKEDNERMKEAETCLLNKDMAQFENLYTTYSGKTMDSVVTYNELTPEQQNKLSEIYSNEVNVYRNSITWNDSNEKYGSIVLTYPYYYFDDVDDEEIKNWLDSKNVVEIDINYDNLGDAEGLLYSFKYHYETMLEYVNENY